MTTLKERLRQDEIVLAPGIYDALSALVAEQAGFEALYLSGASIAYTQLGRSGIGLTTFTEVCNTVAQICERVRVPVIVDADTGFGNALNTHLLANIVEGGKTPVKSAAELQAHSVAIFPGGTARAVAKTLQGYYASLKANGTTLPYQDRMLDFDGLNAVIGTPELLARGKAYEGSR